ncbi:hypothetical protein TcWFU_001999 [Taenia crassiceps]|uniref:Uncharacterized protein n=1 Tax=Taenia crassiceps TaxID=6207 RepID=A0ABR4QCX9_9CEST
MFRPRRLQPAGTIVFSRSMAEEHLCELVGFFGDERGQYQVGVGRGSRGGQTESVPPRRCSYLSTVQSNWLVEVKEVSRIFVVCVLLRILLTTL